MTGDIMVRQASSAYGESAESITSAIDAGSAALLGALIQKARPDGGVKGVLDFISANQIDGQPLSHISGLFTAGEEADAMMNKGNTILKFLAGDQWNAIVDAVSSRSGMKTSSSNALLKIMAPLLLGTVARYIQEKSLDRQGIKSLLESQTPFLQETLPPALKETLGFAAASQATATGPSVPPSPVASVAGKGQPTTFSNILPWIVLLLFALGMFYFVEKGCHGSAKNAIDQNEMQSDTTQVK